MANNNLTSEWKRLAAKEKRFLEKRAEKTDSLLNQKLAEKVPDKLQETLDAAFAKAFHVIFDKGTDYIEKTYNKESLEHEHQVDMYAAELRQDKKALRNFSKKASATGRKNILISGAAGIGMGLVGVGLPDIPVFTGMLLKNIYEIALQYGFEYESEEERYFILRLIEGSLSYGDDIVAINRELNEYIYSLEIPKDYDKEEQIKKTSAALSSELLYMKFLQGIPIVGAVGGAYDVIYMKKVNDYAKLKYNRRFLEGQLLGSDTF